MPTTRRRPSPSSNGKLEDTIATLIQNQATFVAATAEYRRDITRIEAKLAQLDEMRAILLRHERMLAELPETLREKIGFKRRQVKRDSASGQTVTADGR